MRERLLEREAWCFLARACKRREARDYTGGRDGFVLVEDCLCLSLSKMLVRHLIDTKTFYSMKGRIENGLTRGGVRRDFLFPFTDKGASQRAGFCQRMATRSLLIS